MSKLVYFLDIDDTLTKTSRLKPIHLAEVNKSLKILGIKEASKIVQEFAASFGRLFDEHQGIKLNPKDSKLLRKDLKRLKDLQKPILEKYGEVKRWSREAWIYLAGEKFGIKLSNHDLMYITDSLWSKISQTATFYPDALPFLASLQKRNIPFYLITSTDGRLTLDDKTGLFHYDPDYSRKMKLKRLKLLKNIGIKPENIFIADPHDKPDPWVFKQALDKAKKDLKGAKFTSIMIGDSPKSDLYPAKKAGIDKLIWIKREGQKENVGRDIKVLTSLTS